MEGIRPDGSGEGPQLFGQGAEHVVGADSEVAQIGLNWRVPAAFQAADYRVVLELRDAQGQASPAPTPAPTKTAPPPSPGALAGSTPTCTT